METIITPSFVGPLAKAEDSADKFISGMIYCNLLERLLAQQQIASVILEEDSSSSKKSRAEAMVTNEDLEKVWIALGDTFGYEC